MRALVALVVVLVLGGLGPMTTDDLLGRLDSVKRSGSGGWMARCPAHEDRTPSLHVSEGNEGLVLHCHAGCPQEAVIAALGIEPRELFYAPKGNGSRSDPGIEATYDYVDEDGGVLFQQARLFPKDFRLRRPDGRGGWTWGLGDTRRVLYRLPQVIEAASLGKTVYVVEGEKDVGAIESLGATATCNPMGAGKWRDEYAESLRGAHVRIIADKDEPGREHAQRVAESLEGVAASVEVLEAREGNDPHDHVTAGHGLDDFIQAGAPAEDGDTPEETFPLLSELLDRPELLKPPEEVLPRLAWRGRTTGLIGPDKGGKSTLAGHGVVSLTNGSGFLDARVSPGTAVVVAPDEAVGDTVRRLHELGANPDKVRILKLRPPDLLARLDTLLAEHPADFVVVDSLAEWARVTEGRAPEDGDASGWGAVVRPLVQLSRDHDIGLLLLHHPRRSDGQYRGSGEIAAALDCLLEMTMPQSGEDPTLRRFRGRARWPVEDFSVRFEDGERFVLGGGGPVSPEARIIADTAANPGTSRNAQHGRLGGRKATYLGKVGKLVEAGEVVDRDGVLYLPHDVEEALL